jgi:hypothetical protein
VFWNGEILCAYRSELVIQIDQWSLHTDKLNERYLIYVHYIQDKQFKYKCKHPIHTLYVILFVTIIRIYKDQQNY